MSPIGNLASRVSSILCALALSAVAAKTVILQNPWPITEVPYGPSIVQTSGPNTLTSAVFSDKSHWSHTFASDAPGGFYFLNTNSVTGYRYAADGFEVSAATLVPFNLDAQFATKDTVWIVPDTTNPSPRLPSLTTVDPMGKRMVVLFRSPWTSTPSFQVESQAWANFVQTSVGSRWYSTRVGHFTSLKMAIRDYYGSYYLGPTGQTTTSSTVLTLDSTWVKNDTVWILGNSSAPPQILSSAPAALVVMLKNPWALTNPGVAPGIALDGATAYTSMSSAAGWPGWYSFVAPSMLGTVSFRDGLSGSTFLSSVGITPSRGTFLLDTALAKNDTVWVVPSASGIHSVLSAPPVDRSVTLMLRNPWDSLNPGQPPFARIEASDWAPLTAAPGGWYSLSTSISGTRLQVAVRNATGTSYLSSLGLTTSSSNYMVLDTALSKNDTIWIVPQATNYLLARPTEPSPRQGVVMLLNPWEATYPGLSPRVEIESQGQALMSPVAGMPGWYSAPIQVYGSLLATFWDNTKNYSRGRYVLDTALARNDTIWVVFPASSSVPTASSVRPAERTMTILFKSPWDTTAPYLPGSVQVEGRAWAPLVPVSGAAGWYAATVDFFATLQVGIRDSKGTSFIGYNGTTTSSSASLLLDTAYARNDSVWIVGGAGLGTPTGVFTKEPSIRPLTVILQNPWEAAAPGAAPSILVNGRNWQSFQAYAPRPGWYSTSLDFYGSLVVQVRNAAKTSYLYYGGTTTSISLAMALDTAYAKNDTIWIVAGPTSAPRIFSVDPDPKPIVLMLKNPWQATDSGQIPQVQIEGGGWIPFVPVVGDSGWFSASSSFISSLQTTIRLGMGTGYLGPDGTSSQFASLVLDSLVKRNDTIWIMDGAGGKPVRFRTMDPKTSKVVMVFNPWDGVFPLQRPVAFLAGRPDGQVLSPSIDQCGWYFLETESFPKEILLRSSRTGESFGASGIGSTTGLDLAGNLTDTVWVAPAASGARVSHMATPDRGVCALALVPATVRDLKYTTIGQGSSGLVTNLVTNLLGPDRKPVIRRGSPGLPLQKAWFHDSTGVNATTCRDMAMKLDTATGVYRMANSNFYPVDDFTNLPGGAVNPFNDRVSSGYANNLGFCLESHGQFRYRRGQKDTISGQDDIFHYIDGRLVANLGGTHGTLTSSVGFDTLGLVEGNVYPWDLFFCDRMSSFSVLNWTMPGMLANPVARVDSSVTGNVSTLRVSSVRSSGQGCGRVEALAPTRGDVRLKALYDTAWTALQSGVHHGGIRVLDSSGVQVDTSAIVGLPYGIYVVRLRAGNDTLVFRDLVFEVEPPPGTHPYVPNARCDLFTAPLLGSKGCINLGDLDGDTLRVSRNTTRLSTEGLVLCGSASTVVPGTDIVYLLDNSGSMSGSDPTNQRGIILQDALALHNQAAPGSHAAYIPFTGSGNYSPTQLYSLSNPVEFADLTNSINAVSGGDTYYARPLGWARALLQGAKSGTQVQAPSQNKNKAIIMISDGVPGDASASLSVLRPGATTTHLNSTWTLPADSSVPVFGFMITTSNDAMTMGKALYDITQATRGEFIVIPPNDPDSLRSAMMTVLGSIVARARPDTLGITNQTNGQISRGLSGGHEGDGWRFRLDSLVGLEPGVNDLRLRGVLSTDRGDSVVDARWTVVVGDSSESFMVGGKDSTLMVSCHAPTKLKIRPPLDTTRHFADSRDGSLGFYLDARYDKLLRNTVAFWTDVSQDSGRKTLGTATTPDGIRAYSNIAIPWTALAVSRKDSSVQTDFGWDTVRAVYRTPRDRRDSAVGLLPVFRDWPVMVTLSPDTLKADKGEFLVTVRDPNILVDTVRVKIHQNRRDSVWLVLRRDSAGKFTARVPFAQGATVVLTDSILQAGPYRVVVLDSVFALYQTKRDTAILRRPDPRLRFVDASGRLLDSMPRRVLGVGALDTIRLGLYVDTTMISNSTDSVHLTVPSWLSLRTLAGGTNTGRMRLASGKISFVVAATGPGFDGDVRITRPAGPDTLHWRIDVGGLRLRFVDGAGGLMDTARIDMDYLSDTLLRVEVWDGAALCATCDGWMTDSVSNGRVRYLDSLGKAVDSIAIRAGRAVFRMGADGPVSGAMVVLKSPALWARGVAAPVDFRPYRLRYVDGAGKVVDSARVDRDMMTDTLLRVEAWGRSGLCLSCTGKLGVLASALGVSLADSAGKATDSIAVSGGRGLLRIGSDRPVSGAKVTLSGVFLGAASVVSPVTFRPYRLRFVGRDGSVADSFTADTLARRAVLVTVEVWGGGGPVRWNGRLRIDSAGSTLAIADTSGKSGSVFAVVEGRATFQVRSDAPATSRLKVSVDSIGSSSIVGPVTWRIPSPDSAVYLDGNGDGGLDRIVVRFAFPWNPDNDLSFSWPDSGSVLDLSKASRKVSADSLSVEWSFDRAQSPRTTDWRKGTIPARFQWNASATGIAFPAVERIAPVPVRARILRGKGADTLVVWTSERLDARPIASGADLVRRSFPGSARVVSGNPSWDSARQALLLPIDAGAIDSIVRPTDSVRFSPGGGVRDLHGTMVADSAPSVEVEGADPTPLRAVVSDADGDGRADQVVLRFARAPKVVDAFRFSWPARDGKLHLREAKASAAKEDSAGRMLTFRLEPWEFGATQCDSVGCSDLGRMQTTRWGDTLVGTFALEDGVLPVILKAQLRFRRSDRDPDTLRARMSETVKAEDGARWLRYGKPSKDSLGSGIERLGQSQKDRRVLELLVDSSFAAQDGDSVRLAAWPEGGVEDLVGNRPGRFVHWTALELGAPRVKLVAMAWPDVARYQGWSVPPSEPTLSVFVRSGQNAPWKTVEGQAPKQDASHYTGILLKTNKALEGAVLYLYDNMGVAMAFVDLADVQKALRENRLESSLRGDLDAWIAWNGMTRRGTMAPSGVYIARVVGWVIIDGKREVVNQVYTLGWHNPYPVAPPPDLEFLPQNDWTGW